MTLLDRDTLVDRPEIVNRDDDEDEQDAETDGYAKSLGDGGGLTAHGLEFEEGDEDVIAAANTCAVLTTGQEGGEVFEQMFANAAVQLRDLKNSGRDIETLAFFGTDNSIGTAGLSEEDRQAIFDSLISTTSTEEVEEVEEESDEELDQVEEEVEEITNEDG